MQPRVLSATEMITVPDRTILVLSRRSAVYSAPRSHEDPRRS